MKRTLLSDVFAAAPAMARASGVGPAADPKGMTTALSNTSAGTSWHQALLKSWDTVTKKALVEGVVADAPAFTTSENPRSAIGGGETALR